VTIGPMTNAALFLCQRPEGARGLRGIACMGGEPHREFREHNVGADPEAAQRVFASGLLHLEATYDVGARVAMSERQVLALRRAGRLGEALFDLIMLWKPHQTWKEWPVLFDVCPLAWLFAPELFRTERRGVRVELADPARRGMAFFSEEGPRLEVTCDVREGDVLDLVLEALLG